MISGTVICQSNLHAARAFKSYTVLALARGESPKSHLVRSSSVLRSSFRSQQILKPVIGQSGSFRLYCLTLVTLVRICRFCKLVPNSTVQVCPYLSILRGPCFLRFFIQAKMSELWHFYRLPDLMQSGAWCYSV